MTQAMSGKRHSLNPSRSVGALRSGVRLRAALVSLLLALPLAAVGSAPAHATETPLTASFTDVPESHDALSAFTFGLSFSESVATGYATLRDDSFTVTGGSVTGARRVDRRSDLWQITVQPDVPTETDAVADISIELPVTADCDDDGAVCTTDDAKALSNSTTATVAAPPPLTAAFESMPATHDTSTSFSFQMRFNTAVTTSYRILSGSAFDITGGSVTGARRVDRRSDLWQITVQPAAVTDDTVDDDISITLPVTADCDDANAVCTAALRPLSESVAASVEGPLTEAEQSAEQNTEGDEEAIRARLRGRIGNPGDENNNEVRDVPNAPTRVSATAGNRSLSVRWTAVTSDPVVTGFQIWYRPTGTTTWTLGAETGANATSATLTDLTAWVTYEVRVIASNGTDIALSDSATGTPHSDFDLEVASRGLWSDGTTIWAAQFYDNRGKPRVYAYELATGARDESKDFSPSDLGEAPNLLGLCSNGTTWWVASGSTAWAFSVSEGTRDIHKDISIWGSPPGLWCSSAQLLAVRAGTVDTLRAYALPDGTRDPHSDVASLVAAGNTSPAGVWTDGDAVWVSDYATGKVYAYGRANGWRRPGMDFDGLAARGNTWPNGIWSDGSTMWVVDSYGNKVYSYPMPNPTDGGPEAWSATVSEDGSAATILFDEPLDTDVIPDADRFSVTVGSDDAAEPTSVTHTEGDNRSVTLGLPSTADVGEEVTIAYTAPTGDQTAGVVQDDDDSIDLASFAGLPTTRDDFTGPTVRVRAGRVRNSFRATDGESGSVWHYVWIAGSAACDSSTDFADATDYTEGRNVTYTIADYGDKLCFSSADTLNNVGYGASSVVTLADTTAPTVNVRAGSVLNSFQATDGESGSVWHYVWTAGSAACGSSTSFASGTGYTAGTNVVYASDRFGQQLCFRSVDSWNNAGYGTATVTDPVYSGTDQTGTCNRTRQEKGKCDLATATTLEPGRSVVAAIDKRKDVDWFRVELVEGTVYRVDMEGWSTSAGTLLDPLLRGMYAVFEGSVLSDYQADGLLDGDDDEIEPIWYRLDGECTPIVNDRTDCERFNQGTYYNDDGGVGFNSRMFLRDFPTGVHYVAARDLHNEIGTYTITLTEVTDDAADARTLALSSTATSAVIDFPGDTDTFDIMLDAGTDYTITLQNPGWDAWTGVDIEAVYTATDTSVDITGDGPTYTITPTTSGTHQFTVSGVACCESQRRHQRFATGDYTIAITE